MRPLTAQLPRQSISPQPMAWPGRQLHFQPRGAGRHIGGVISGQSAAAPGEQTTVARVKANLLVTAEGESEVRHMVLEVGEGFRFREGQSVGIVAPAAYGMCVCPVASAQGGESGQRGHLAVTIERGCVDGSDYMGHGAGLSRLCELQVGDSVSVLGPYGQGFMVPEDKESDLLMICSGASIAPMRAIIERRRQSPTEGKHVLFYAGRTSQELPYYSQFQQMPAGFVDLNFTSSHATGAQIYQVQDLVRSRALLIARMLAARSSYIYLCGSRETHDSVLKAFRDICAAHGLDWWKLLEDFAGDGRLQISTCEAGIFLDVSASAFRRQRAS